MPKNSAARSGSWCASSRMKASTPGKQLAVPVFLERQIGEQQVVVDDHEVGLERRAARREHVAARELRAARAGAGLARARELRAQRVRLAERRRPPPGRRCACRAGPVRSLRQQSPDRSPGNSEPCAAMAVKLRSGTGSWRGPSAARSCTGRPSAPASNGMSRLYSWSWRVRVPVEISTRRPDSQRRHQVGEGLAGAGPRLHQQLLAPLQRLGDALGHAALRRARHEARRRRAPARPRAEDLGQSGSCEWARQWAKIGRQEPALPAIAATLDCAGLRGIRHGDGAPYPGFTGGICRETSPTGSPMSLR